MTCTFKYATITHSSKQAKQKPTHHFFFHKTGGVFFFNSIELHRFQVWKFKVQDLIPGTTQGSLIFFLNVVLLTNPQRRDRGGACLFFFHNNKKSTPIWGKTFHPQNTGISFFFFFFFFFFYFLIIFEVCFCPITLKKKINTKKPF